MHNESPFTKEGDIAGSAHNRDHPITTTFDQEKYDIGNGQHIFMNKQQEYKRKGPMFNDCYKAPTTRTPKRIKPETNRLQPGTLYQ